jgi:hypothetical protein
MSYRGEDLDLRTPQMGHRPAIEHGTDGGLRGRGYGSRSEPIWVDETVLACCNLAYDLAVTHRSGEVRIEHLVYALTRIDAAAEALESRGVRVAALRREMGSIVASDIPIGLPNGKGTPRRSEEMEFVLRDAADLAQRRNQPANIDDLVIVLVDSTRELSGLMHIRRHLGSRSPLDRADYEPLTRPRETALRPAYVPASPPVPAYEPRAWSEPLATSGSRTDAVQNSRIEMLEQAVRSLSADLGNERKTMNTLLLDIQRDVGSRRDEDGRLGGGVIDRLASIEHAIEKRLSELSRSWTVLNDRLQMLESAVHKQRPDGVELVALHDRLTGLERILQVSTGDGNRHWSTLADRLKGIEATLHARASGGTVELGPLSDRFDTIEQVLLERASDATAEAARMAERLKAIEDAQAAQKTQAMALSSGIAAEVSKLAATLAQQPAGERLLPAMTERFQVLAAMIERQRSELSTSLVTPVGERLAAIGTAVDSRQVETTRAVSTLAERVAAIERSMTGYVQKVSEQATAYDQDLNEIQDALIKLGTHQATISGGLDQWRQQASEIGIISNRLAAIERLSSRPAQMIEQLSERVDTMYRLTAEKIEKRNAFYYWLFGTNSWITASWPQKRSGGQTLATQQVKPATPPATTPRA